MTAPTVVDSPARVRARNLAARLETRSAQNPTFWDFADNGARQGGHAFFQYPAMMVPELQGALLDDLIAIDPEARLVFDPFMGSGTVLLESLYRGLNFHGTDINPLAVLLATVKAAPPTEVAAQAAVESVLSAAARLSQAEAPHHNFLHRDKWFTEDVTADLSRLRLAIQTQDSGVRGFLWICLAETIRWVSNSRTSTFKLHSYAPEVLAERSPQAFKTFEWVGSSNAKRAGEHWTRLNPESSASASAPEVTLLRVDATVRPSQQVLADALMTSPPYGDNDTTVPYGQHSYLPLQWIDHRDLPGNFDPALLSTTRGIDFASLGGSKVNALQEEERLVGLSEALGEFLPQLEARSWAQKKVLAFARDYDAALTTASAQLRPGGFSFWTLGQRRVSGLEVPLVQMTREFLEAAGHDFVSCFTRQLPVGRKRMAVRNSEGQTMADEQILVMQKSESV